MKHYRIRWLLYIVGLVAPALYAQESYYSVIGVTRSAPPQDIRRQCVIKLNEVNTVLEPQRRQKDAQLQAARASKSGDVTGLEREVADLQQRIVFIRSACEILQDPAQKANYDAVLSSGPVVEANAERAEIAKYCSDRETSLNAQKRDLGQQLSQPNLPDKITQELRSGISVIDRKLDDMRNDCATLSDPKNPAYKATLEKIRADKIETTVPKEYEAGVFGNIQRMVDTAKTDADVKIFNVLGPILSKIPIPDVGGRIFNQDIAMRNMKILPGPTGPNIRKGLGFTGTLNFNNMQVKGTLFAVELKTTSVAQFSFSIELPDYYKISNIFPQFKQLDVLTLPKGKLILSSFDYTDPDGYPVQNGLNFLAGLDLAGPLKALDDLKNKARDLKSIVFRFDAPITFGGVIPPDIAKTSFQSRIPLRLGVDFTKIPRMPKSITDIFKEVTTDDFVFKVALPANFAFETGIRLVLGTQPAPLTLNVLGSISPQVITMGVRLRELELKFINLVEAGIQFDMDQALMPVALAFGVPFTGFAVQGEIDLGTAGPQRVKMKFAGGARVSGTSIPDLIMQGEVRNVDVTNLINLASKVIAKTGIARELPADKMPVMKIDLMRGYLVVEDTTIAGKTYNAGFGLALNAQLFEQKFGFSFDIEHKKLRCKGLGYMSKVDLSMKGKRILTISGPGYVGVTTDGPVISCDFDFSSVEKMLQGTFVLKGAIEIPPIDLNVKADLTIQGKSFKADLEATYVGFTTVFGINLDPAKWQDMYLKFGFKGDFEKFLSEQAKPALLDLKREAESKLAQVDAKLGDLSRTLRSAQQQGVSAAQAEIDKTRGIIRRLESQIAALRKECDDASLIAKAYICPKVGAQLVKPGTELAAQKTYLEGLLKPGKEVIRTSTAVAADASKAIAEAELFRKTVSGMITGLVKAIDGIGKGSSFIKVTEAIGEVSAKDLGDGKLPKLISFVASVNIPDLPAVRVELKNIQFDFKNPKGSGLDLAKKLITAVKVG